MVNANTFEFGHQTRFILMLPVASTVVTDAKEHVEHKNLEDLENYYPPCMLQLLMPTIWEQEFYDIIIIGFLIAWLFNELQFL